MSNEHKTYKNEIKSTIAKIISTDRLATYIQTGFFIYLSVHLSDVHGLEITWDGPVPYCSVLIYNPYRRWEAWRYLTYMQV